MANNKKKVLFISVIVCCFVTVLILIVFISKNLVNKKVSTPSFLYNASYNPSNTVTIKNILPVSDILGKTFDGTGTKDGIQGYTEITIENTDKIVHNYYILVTKQRSDHDINDHYIKLYLTNISDSPIKGFDKNSVPNYASLLVSDKKPESRVLAKVSVAGGEKTVFKLKSWLADDYIVSLGEEQFKYVVDVIEEY